MGVSNIMEYRQATVEDIDAFIDYRMEFVTLIRKLDNEDDFRIKTKDYLLKHIDNDDLIIYIALEDHVIVSSCMACVFQTAPLPSCPEGKTAELLNVYTKEKYRRKGLAEKLVSMLLNNLKENNIKKVVLEYTDDGFSLYKKLGFMEIDHQMQLRL